MKSNREVGLRVLVQLSDEWRMWHPKQLYMALWKHSSNHAMLEAAIIL